MEELKFPLDCQFKIIAENTEDIRMRIEIALQELGISAPLETGHLSEHAKYIAFHFDVRLESRESMDRIDRTLRAIKGVKVVL